jgi:hypothetical protein
VLDRHLHYDSSPKEEKSKTKGKKCDDEYTTFVDKWNKWTNGASDGIEGAAEVLNK